MQLFAARLIVIAPGVVHPGGGVLVDGGSVRALANNRGALRRLARREALRVTELGDGVLTPGLIDAHVHLELGALAGRVPLGGGLRDWIDRLLPQRFGLSSDEMTAGARASADELLASGTTAVGDIDSGARPLPLGRHPLRRTIFRECLDGGDPERIPGVLARVRRALPARDSDVEGLSPHAPYSVSPALQRELAGLAERRSLPLAIHWAETLEEGEWLRHGRGAFEGLCRNSPRRPGLELLAEAGLLGPRTALIHGNHPTKTELERIAASGARVVHCPGSHAFFERGAFPWKRYRQAGVELALGTDSAASNEALDMRREMALFRRRARELAPSDVFRMATESAARAIGRGDELGSLLPGRRFDAALFDLHGQADGESLFDALTLTRPAVSAVWVSGRCRWRGDASTSPPPSATISEPPR